MRKLRKQSNMVPFIESGLTFETTVCQCLVKMPEGFEQKIIVSKLFVTEV